MQRIKTALFLCLVVSKSIFGMEGFLVWNASTQTNQKKVKCAYDIKKLINDHFATCMAENGFIFEKNVESKERTIQADVLRKMVKQYNSYCDNKADCIDIEAVIQDDELTLSLELTFPRSYNEIINAKNDAT